MWQRSLTVLFLIGIGIVILTTTRHIVAVETAVTVTFIEPSSEGVTLPELDEFATMVMGDPWDMEQPTDLAYYRSDSQLLNSTFTDGVYSAQMTSGDGQERITLLTAGAPNNEAMRIGKIGYNYPINADHYRYLTYRLYKSHTNVNSGLIQWFAEDAYTNNVMGVSNGFLIPAESGWHTMVVDLQEIGIQLGQQDWEGTIRELIIKPFAGPGAAGATVKLDWARLTAEDPRTARPYTVSWRVPADSNDTIDLYASAGNKTLDERSVLLAANVPVTDGEYTIQTGILPAGDYYIAAQSANGSISWSDGPLIINTVPLVTIDKPSKLSGEDYAETVLGKAWDMTSEEDMNYNLLPWQQQSTCVTDETFVNGIYTAHLIPHCPDGVLYVDPILYLGHLVRTPHGVMDPPIDTSRYRYLSYRFLHSGTENVQEGWMVRWGWWQVDGSNATVTEPVVMGRDLMILEGWNTYKADLWAPDVVDEVHPIQRSWLDSAPNRLRFDPSELNSNLMPAHIQLDWIKLTAMDEVQAGDLFPILFELNKPGVELTFYYDTDTNPNNGRTLIGSTTIATSNNGILQPAQPSEETITNMPHLLYLPLMMNRYFECEANECFIWDTTGVTPGTYYVCIEAEDEFNRFYQCSEAPMVVK